jgi:hypothetical protein
VDQLAREVERIQPKLWKGLYTKILNPPNGYSSWKLPSVAIAVALLEGARKKDAYTAGSAGNIRHCAHLLKKYDFPTYYVGRELLRSLLHTKPPSEQWQDVPLPFPAMTFMLPEGFVKEPHTGQSIQFVSYARMPLGSSKTNLAFDNPEIDRLHIWYATHNGVNLQSVVFPVNQKLEPSKDWLKEATDYYDGYYKEHCKEQERTGPQLPRAPEDFLVYLSGLVANLILIKQARPELLSEPGSGHINTARNGNKFYRPIWLGEKYVSRREEGVAKLEAAGHFTELRWRAGHWRLQHYGPGNRQTKVIWLESYMAHGGNLVRENQMELAGGVD